MTPDIRPARHADASGMAVLINEIIGIGGTTAYQAPLSKAQVVERFIAPPLLLGCFVAVCEGRITGFQVLERCDPDWTGEGRLPQDWAVIATFVARGMQGRGIGRTLFGRSRQIARDAGIPTIDATIRADNEAGLRYYAGLGFEDYDVLRQIPLSDGTRVDRIRKRYDVWTLRI